LQHHQSAGQPGVLFFCCEKKYPRRVTVVKSQLEWVAQHRDELMEEWKKWHD